jgi:putative ABC transport system permease protein
MLTLALGIGAVTIISGASLATNRLLVNQLFNTSPTDPTTFAAVTMAVVLIGAIAGWVPARRAVRVEPMAALRHD